MSSLRTFAFVMLIVTAATAALSAATLRGHFSSVVKSDLCASIVGICTEGTLTGALKGTFTFTATSLTASVDSATTGVMFYTGDIRLTTRDGVLFCKDAGAFDVNAPGAVSSVCSITGGTGEFAGATGTIQFVGTFTFADGGDGEYRAMITVP
ncbi:MAG TPA: hypothetical protein VJ691_03930 [Vicinamibacterales bacterium]|nr:hypothetical protein [Vicinamibacterales bacterium]